MADRSSAKPVVTSDTLDVYYDLNAIKESEEKEDEEEEAVEAESFKFPEFPIKEDLPYLILIFEHYEV
jgi:hypothetical protein